MENLFCGSGQRKGQALVDRAIMAALAYPSEGLTLMAYLSPQWQKVELSEAVHKNILGAHSSRGLAFDIWYHADDQIAVISFRGTDTRNLQESLKDWTSNLHWLVGRTPIVTQYDVLYDALPRIMEFMDQAIGNVSEVHTVGHSLGGGLAQYSLYRDADLNNRRVKHAFVFNSSPVTGWSDFELQQGDLPGTTVTRINEYKEILEFPRLLMKPGYALNPRLNIDPRFDEYRLDLNSETGTAAHEMTGLAKKIVSLTESLCAERSE
ncbi:Mbeg1-like protein [Ruegeria arenilitoris]|uniref:Mbeg1-like protein n=1 Tax=Ruegeria arenilitoris TaxID=1173585 RepID=UPI00147F68BB|nr:Mbeg1-like protein [Ruegeria arenilitoris]